MKHRFTAEALSDYETAVVYYETQEPGLGARFIIDVDELISTMLEFPRMGRVVDGTPPDLEIRRCIVTPLHRNARSRSTSPGWPTSATTCTSSSTSSAAPRRRGP